MLGFNFDFFSLVTMFISLPRNHSWAGLDVDGGEKGRQGEGRGLQVVQTKRTHIGNADNAHVLGN